MPTNSKITRQVIDGVEEITMESHELVLEPLSDLPHQNSSRVLFHEAKWTPGHEDQARSRIQRQRNFTSAKKESPRLLFAVIATVLVGAVVYRLFFT